MGHGVIATTICNKILEIEHLGTKNISSKEPGNIEFACDKDIWRNVTISMLTKVKQSPRYIIRREQTAFIK